MKAYKAMKNIVLSVTALLLSIIILQLANSIVAPTIVLNAARAGDALTSVGMIPTIYGLGFVIGCFWSRNLISAIGHIRSFTVAAAILSALTLLMYLIPDTLALIIFRGFMGCAIAIIMTCIDSWVGYVTPFEMRGRVMAFYSSTTKLAYVGAPALLSFSALVSEQAIIIAVLLFILSLIPICITKLPQPDLKPVITTSFRALINAAPSAFVAVFVLGLANSAVLNLIPVYGVGIGFSVPQALTILMIAHVGGLILQWPLGYFSDIISRRKVMAIGFFVSTLTAIAMAFVTSENITPPLILSFIWGGAALSMYSVSLSHAIDHVNSEETVAVCATILTTWSIGSIFGPILAGIVMENFNPAALYLLCAAFHGIAGTFIILRIMTTARRIRKSNVTISSPM